MVRGGWTSMAIHASTQVLRDRVDSAPRPIEPGRSGSPVVQLRDPGYGSRTDGGGGLPCSSSSTDGLASNVWLVPSSSQRSNRPRIRADLVLSGSLSDSCAKSLLLVAAVPRNQKNKKNRRGGTPGGVHPRRFTSQRGPRISASSIEPHLTGLRLCSVIRLGASSCFARAPFTM